MRFSLQREALLKPLTQVVNVVERRQTLPVLANFLVQVQGGQLSLTGTDLEVEMIARSAVDDAQDGETTIPARKLFEIVRALPDGSKVTVSQTGDKVTVQAGRSRFTLATLPANDFPSVDEVEATERVTVPEAALKELIREHVEATGSPRGKEILDNFSEYLPKFKKVLPYDYDRMLRIIASMEERGLDGEQAQIEAFYAVQKKK